MRTARNRRAITGWGIAIIIILVLVGGFFAIRNRSSGGGVTGGSAESDTGSGLDSFIVPVVLVVLAIVFISKWKHKGKIKKKKKDENEEEAGDEEGQTTPQQTPQAQQAAANAAGVQATPTTPQVTVRLVRDVPGQPNPVGIEANVVFKLRKGITRVNLKTNAGGVCDPAEIKHGNYMGGFSKNCFYKLVDPRIEITGDSVEIKVKPKTENVTVQLVQSISIGGPRLSFYKPNINVKLTNIVTKVQVEKKTGRSGRCRFNTLEFGTYNVELETDTCTLDTKTITVSGGTAEIVVTEKLATVFAKLGKDLNKNLTRLNENLEKNAKRGK